MISGERTRPACWFWRLAKTGFRAERGEEKVHDGASPSPARESRALPRGALSRDSSSMSKGDRTPGGHLAEDHRSRRSQGVVRGAASAIAARALALLVGIISVPLMVGYLGSERYGVWVTISTFLAFLSFTDFGLANSLTNALGKAYGENEREIARRYVSSSFATLSLIALLLLFGAAVVWANS